ncbi:MAG: tetratricopeptide repeat protein [Novosphingobium sp.]|uniref:tetratricopeptide repeat protein n=1 Tax=Novosphingobium sp. TaxID=1874826 RepID=UPI0030177BCA
MKRGGGSAQSRFAAGLALHRSGRLPEALSAYDEALRADPKLVGAHNNRGIALSQIGRTQDALTSFERAIALDPRHADALANRGLALGQLARFADALASFDTALAIQPGHALASAYRMQAAESLFAQAEELAGAGRHGEALAAFTALAAHDPARAQAHYGAGAMHWQLGDAAAALACCERALGLAPELGPAHNLRGRALQQLGRGDESLAAFDRALVCNPSDALAHLNRGWQLRHTGRLEEALAAFLQTQILDPTLPYVESQILELRLRFNDWKGFAAARDAVVSGVTAGTTDVVPFVLLPLTDEPAVQRAAAARFLAQTYPRVSARPAPHPPGKRLRVAYLSADFHDHATMYLLADVLDCHDAGHVELTAMSYGVPAGDVWRERAAAACARFIDVREHSDSAIAELVRSLQIDVAVDLKGLTAGGRPGIFAARAAPVQASYLGYPGTLPAPFMDYFIGDPVTNPPVERDAFAEALALLPPSYQANCRLAEPAAPQGSRADHNLPETGAILCCFNANYKITPEVFALWLEIMAAVPDSVLWLWVDQQRARENLVQEAAAHGIPRERLVFADFLGRAAHLARLAHADLFLDTFPCGAHTTASDALRAGLPLITLPGRTFASRVGASLLTASGLGELIALSPAQYKALAIELASDPARRAALRARLREAVPGSRLFDPRRQARNLERAYAEMDARARRGEAPADFAVRED